MSTRPSSSKRGCGVSAAAAFLWLFSIVVIISISKRAEQSVRPQPQPASGPAAPARNPIEDMLRPPAGAARVDGVGVALLVDTSGSMENPPRTGGEKKIETARRSALDVIGKVEAFARAHPDRKVMLAVYEFSARDGVPPCRSVVPLQAPALGPARSAVAAMQADGGTPIGDAIIQAKRALDGAGLTHQHIIVVTDGENNRGYKPGDVIDAISRLDESWRASVYFIAFDVSAAPFGPVRDAGGLVLAAANAQELHNTLDYILTGKILVEQPVAPGK